MEMEVKPRRSSVLCHFLMSSYSWSLRVVKTWGFELLQNVHLRMECIRYRGSLQRQSGFSSCNTSMLHNRSIPEDKPVPSFGTLRVVHRRKVLHRSASSTNDRHSSTLSILISFSITLDFSTRKLSIWLYLAHLFNPVNLPQFLTSHLLYKVVDRRWIGVSPPFSDLLYLSIWNIRISISPLLNSVESTLSSPQCRIFIQSVIDKTLEVGVNHLTTCKTLYTSVGEYSLNHLQDTQSTQSTITVPTRCIIIPGIQWDTTLPLPEPKIYLPSRIYVQRPYFRLFLL
jgi:hypothetical protein